MEKSEAAHQLPRQPVKKEETTFPPFGRPALLMLTQHYSLLISPEDPPRLPTVGFLKKPQNDEPSFDPANRSNSWI